MQALAYFLGAVEYVLVPVSLLGLVWAMLRRSRRARRWSVPLALGLAVTVAQPFGIVANRVAGPPPGAKFVGSTDVHVARIGGVVPILPFVLYREDILGPVGDQSPTARLKARSWLWLPILTNATRIHDICASDVTVPCWSAATSRTSIFGTGVSLEEKAGRFYVTLYAPLGPRFRAPARYTWELAPGIASIAGLIYWALVAVLVPFALVAGRRTEKGALPLTDPR